MEKIFVSACLTGAQVRHDGGAKLLGDPILATWRAEGRLLVMCPEMAAGQTCPRPPAEIASGSTAEKVLNGRGRVVDDTGLDLTAEYRQAAQFAVDLCQANECRFALMTDASPSCGVTRVHTGKFNGQTQDGQGVTTAALRAAGVQVFADHQVRELAAAIAAFEKYGR